MRTTLQAVNAAIQAAQGHPRGEFFSRAFPRDPTKETQVASLFRADCDPDFRAQHRMNPELTKQYAVIVEGRIAAITRPTLASVQGNNGAVILGSLSDTINTIVPAKVSKDALLGHFVSLVPTGAVDGLDLPTAPEEPQHLEAPQPDDGSNPPPPGFERLHFEVHDAADVPKAVAFPVALPIPIGTKIPIGHSINDPLTPDQSDWQLFRAWFAAHQYTYQYNNYTSISAGGLLFEADAFSGPQFDVLLMHPDIGNLSLELLFPHDPHHKNVMDIMHQEQRSTWLAVAESIPDIADNAQQGPNQLGQLDLQALVAGAIQAGTQQSPTKRTLTEEEHLSHASDIQARYSVAFAAVVTDPDDASSHVVPATISDSFAAIIKTSKQNIAMRQAQDTLGTTLRKAIDSDSRIQAGCTLVESQLDGPLLTRLRGFQHMTTPIVQDPARVQSELTAFNFLTVRADSVTYQDRIRSGLRVEAQVLMGEDKTKQARRVTDLYFQGKQESLVDVLAAISNIFILFSLISADFKDSALWLVLQAYYKACSTTHARGWADMHRDNPVVFHNMMVDVANIMAPFMALGNQLEYRQAVTNQQPISPEAYAQPSKHGHFIVAQLAQLLAHMQAGRYKDEPCTYAYFFPNRSPATTDIVPKVDGKPPGKQGGKTNPGKDGGRPGTGTGKGKDKQQPPGRQTSPELEAAKKEGLLEYKGTNHKFKYPDILVPISSAPNATKTNFCMNKLLKGRACTRGNECRLFHVASFDAVPDSAKEALTKYVADTEGLEFVQGQGPPAGTN